MRNDALVPHALTSVTVRSPNRISPDWGRGSGARPLYRTEPDMSMYRSLIAGSKSRFTHWKFVALSFTSTTSRRCEPCRMKATVFVAGNDETGNDDFVIRSGLAGMLGTPRGPA